MRFDSVGDRPCRSSGVVLWKRIRRLTTAESVLLIIVSITVLIAAMWYDLMIMDRLVSDGWL